MISLQPFLVSLLKALPPHPISQQSLDGLVSKTLKDSDGKVSLDNRKSQWEFLLKNEIFTLAETEGSALQNKGISYYEKLRDQLDLVLTFTEHDACEQTFPFIVLQDLLETQTIASCSHIFSWIEERASRLTEGMIPQKGKALILLRTLNDLLRRLSKMGSTTIFCGRILTFLSGVFPLGERSGVNLRGEYGPLCEIVTMLDHSISEGADTEMAVDTLPDADQEAKMQVDNEKPSPLHLAVENKADLYNTFWSLQLPLSRPPLFANKSTFPDFKDAVNKVLPIIKEATAKERAMMGSRGIVGSTTFLKRKRETDSEESNTNEYFFAKFLTSPELLDLEIADTHFRRQIIFQLLVILNHLLTFTKASKAMWISPRNRSLQMDFTLESEDAQWVNETINKAFEELRQTTPHGRAFAETVTTILERERNWVKWKNELCFPFDKEPWATELGGKKLDLFEATKEARHKNREAPDWQWKLGSKPLTEIWDLGYRSLVDLQNPFQPGEVKDFQKKIKQENARIELRQKHLAKVYNRTTSKPEQAAASTLQAESDKTSDILGKDADAVQSENDGSSAIKPAPGQVATLHPSLPTKPGSPSALASASQDDPKSENVTPTIPSITLAAPMPVMPASVPVPMVAPALAKLPTDSQIIKFEENKQRWAWLALRTARDLHLQHFGKIGTGDIDLLVQEIEKEKKSQRIDEAPSAVNMVEDQGAGSPNVSGMPSQIPDEKKQEVEMPKGGVTGVDTKTA